MYMPLAQVYNKFKKKSLFVLRLVFRIKLRSLLEFFHTLTNTLHQLRNLPPSEKENDYKQNEYNFC